MIRSIILAWLFIAVVGAISGSLAMFNAPMLMGAKSKSGGGGGGGGGNVVCDYGPNTTLPTGTVGTDLTTAGFGHCALNADFTDNSGATVGHVGSWVMNTPSTYIASCGSAVWGKLWLMFISGSGTENDAPGAAPCNRATIANDATIGKNILTYQFAPSEITIGGSAAASKVGIAIYWPLCGDSCFSLRPALPQAIYEEITYKIIGFVNKGTIHGRDQQTFFNGFDYGCGVGCGIDMVMGEINANNAQSATSLDNYISSNKFSNGWFWTPDEGNYHTLASLSTTNGSTTFNTCVYFDGNAGLPSNVPSGSGITNFCSHVQNFSSTELVAHDRRTWEFVGDYANWNDVPPPTTSSLSATVQIQIQKIRVITCANYTGLGNHCPGTLVFH